MKKIYKLEAENILRLKGEVIAVEIVADIFVCKINTGTEAGIFTVFSSKKLNKGYCDIEAKVKEGVFIVFNVLKGGIEK